MLLMQYNDNIPAVFGFPLVIPHQRRGGMEEEERGQGEYTVLGNAWLFLSFSPSLLSCPHCSFLHSCPLRQACCPLQLGLNIEFNSLFLSIITDKGYIVGVFYFGMPLKMICLLSVDLSLQIQFYHLGTGMKETTAINQIIPLWQSGKEWKHTS